MSKKIIRLITLVLAIAMVAGLAVGCGGTTDVSSSDSSTPTKTDDKVEGMQADVRLEDYVGTTVKYVSWKDPWQNEDGDAIDKFVQETGIKVEWVQCGEGSGYVNQIAASIASDQQGDVFFQSNTFPSSLTVMQPLDASKIDLTDPVWNQSLIKASTLDGHAYLVDALSNVWSEVDICVYNRKLFEDNGITSPAEYYENGDWTFANFRQACIEVSSLGKNYTGATMLGEPILGAAGAAFFTYKDNKISVTADQHLYEVMNYLAKMHDDGYAKYGREDFADGKTGMAITNCFALKKTGYFGNINADMIAATYLPVWEKGDEQCVSGIYRGWGLIDGAKNPVAAGIFLRQYLDVTNYDLSKTFHNSDVADFFFEVTSTVSDNVIYNMAADLRTSTGLGDQFYDYFHYYPATQINSVLDSNKNIMNLMCERANDMINAERQWIEEAEANGKLPKANQ